MLPRFAKTSAKVRNSDKSFERRLLASVLITGLPGVILSLFLLWNNSYSWDHKLEGTSLVLFLWIALSVSACQAVIHSLRVLSNLVAALKEEDFSFRAAQAVPGDALGDLAIEINELARALERERIGTIDSTNLLRRVMDKADAVIVAFTADTRVCLLNRAGAEMLGIPEDQILNRTAAELGIKHLLEGPSKQAIAHPFSKSEKRWIVDRTSFRQGGVPHLLIVLSDASEALRAEERSAWQRIIRVLGHEINNSLAPIKSIARTQLHLLSNGNFPSEVTANVRHGLEIIHGRAESLNRFLQSYARLAQLPPPTRRMVALETIIARVAGMESRLSIKVLPGPDLRIEVDLDQLEQALINLIHNAVDAYLMKDNAAVEHDSVTISWAAGAELQLWIRDRGIGLPSTENLFVPFYTTKATGSGIGLPLSRQIIEAHGGSLTLRNRFDGDGCEAEIRLPIQTRQANSSNVPNSLRD